MVNVEKPQVITAENALPGRDQVMPMPGLHTITGHQVHPPFAQHLQQVVFGLGCFWGAERRFWQQEGVYSTAVGYSGGFTSNANYEEVCSGGTGHSEVVLVVFDPQLISYQTLLKVFWESHNPTQGMRQGNDVGSQYRSVIYTDNEEQQQLAQASSKAYQQTLTDAGHGKITTEIELLGRFFFAEEYHQQYLDKNPQGYCGIGGTGVSCPIGLG